VRRFLQAVADTQLSSVLSLPSLLVQRSAADAAYVVWHVVTCLMKTSQNLHGNHISIQSAKQQISWKPHLKGTIKSTIASSDRGENGSDENNVLSGLALPESLPKAKVEF